MTLKVQRKSCATCIYRKSTNFDIKQLEAQVADPRMPGHFSKYRQCHHSNVAVCAGFWSRHKDKFDIGQLAQRLGMVELVDHDTLKEKKHAATATKPIRSTVVVKGQAPHQSGEGRRKRSTGGGNR